MADLFEAAERKAAGKAAYTAKDIEVLEGLEPVRRRPGMYVGGTDENALHHLVAEVLDNAMDEAVAGHASRIDISLGVDGAVTVTDVPFAAPRPVANRVMASVQPICSHVPAPRSPVLAMGADIRSGW